MSVTLVSRSEVESAFAAPCFLARVRAGFPSPADDYMDRRLDLNEYLIHHKEATFYCWVQGESMEGVGIFDGDLLIVDRAEDARDGDVVLASLNGELTCKILDIPRRRLIAAHQDYPPIVISEGACFEVEGTVISSIRLFRARPR
ncbi:LexA family protein [Halomonas binhaiensis]|uniref:Translesion error-prone DNA polymerase V autoproteolytic subunit n=1 Tax=Halomonas binhaiensis TaxID=2562282 RepID=A0A5C1NB54_9GAMM|nr:translesion error-prone DNA polymerase V autoproteolytic subunit [Halomonas binhaiensis]QEM80201.1 translesion error-prone DNA polymerase V autoproteolytic subunit [Halomonas binhaiensis]